MGFSSGTVSFRRFTVIGQAPGSIDQDLLDRLEAHALRERDLGVPEEVEYGWCGGRHVLDASFSFEHNVFADALSCAIRVDTNKVPSELKKAYQLLEEESAAKDNPSGFVSKNQKRDARDVVRRKVDDDLRSGRFRRSRMTPVLWDLPTQTLYSNASGTTQEKLLELFERTFDLKLAPLSAGSVALRSLERQGKRRDYEDLRPTRFVIGPEGDNQRPDYPWTAKGDEAKDFLGNEFLLWLWQQADVHDGTIKTRGGEMTAMIDRTLDLDCAYGATGKCNLKSTGVARMPEAIDALRSGKVPRKAGLSLDASGIAYAMTLSAERLAVASLILPNVEEADSPRVLFEERIAMLREFCRALDELFDAFLSRRTGGGWERAAGDIGKWIRHFGKPVSVAVA